MLELIMLLFDRCSLTCVRLAINRSNVSEMIQRSQT